MFFAWICFFFLFFFSRISDCNCLVVSRKCHIFVLCSLHASFFSAWLFVECLRSSVISFWSYFCSFVFISGTISQKSTLLRLHYSLFTEASFNFVLIDLLLHSFGIQWNRKNCGQWVGTRPGSDLYPGTLTFWAGEPQISWTWNITTLSHMRLTSNIATHSYHAVMWA